MCMYICEKYMQNQNSRPDLRQVRGKHNIWEPGQSMPSRHKDKKLKMTTEIPTPGQILQKIYPLEGG